MVLAYGGKGMGKCVASVETHGLANDALGASADSVSERALRFIYNYISKVLYDA